CARSQPVDSLFLSSPTQPPTASYTLSLHDALPIYAPDDVRLRRRISRDTIERGRTPDAVVAQCRSTVFPAHSRYVEPTRARADRSEEHTSELQSRRDLVCRLLLEKKKKDGGAHDSH